MVYRATLNCSRSKKKNFETYHNYCKHFTVFFFSFKIVCPFIDLFILIIFSEYNAVVWWYFSFLKHSDRYHFFSIGICSNMEIFLINLYHLYIRKTICERYFMINLKFFNIIFFNKFINICEKIILKKFAVR